MGKGYLGKVYSANQFAFHNMNCLKVTYTI